MTGLIILGVIIFLVIIGKINSYREEQQKKEQERIDAINRKIQERINKGELVKLVNGTVKEVSKLSYEDIIALPDYVYLNQHNKLKYLYPEVSYHEIEELRWSLSSLSLAKLASYAKIVREKIRTEERIEAEKEKAKKAEEIRLAQLEKQQQYDQEELEKRIKRWEELQKNIIFILRTVKNCEYL